MFMKRKLLLLLAGFAWFSSQGQLVNDGATIVIQPGATLFVESSFQNVSGTLDNQGTIEVMGDFSNDAGSMINNAGLIKFTGSTTPSLVSLNGAVLNNVQINKVGQNVVLQDAMTINGALTFGGSSSPRLILGSNNLVLGSGASTTGATSATGYVDASGSGTMTKQFSPSPALFNFPIGDNDDYSPLEWTPGSGASGAGNVSASVVDLTNPNGHPNKPAVIATDYISRYWKVNSTTYPSILAGTYVPSDINGTASKIKGASYKNAAWSYAGASNTGSSVIGNATANATTFDFTGTAIIGTVKLQAFLSAAYIGSNTMSTTLRNLVVIPFNSPYGDGASVGTMNSQVPLGVTDWVLLELTNPNDSGDPIISKGAFIKSDGKIVDLDGMSDPQILGAYNPAFVRIKHRNHLSIRTLNGIDTQTPILQDFTLNNNNVYLDNSVSNTQQNPLAGGKWGLWAGDANGNGTVSYTGGTHDRDAILLALSFNPNNSLTNVYNRADVNMNGTVSYTGGTHDRDAILLYLGFNPNSSKKQH